MTDLGKVREALARSSYDKWAVGYRGFPEASAPAWLREIADELEALRTEAAHTTKLVEALKDVREAAVNHGPRGIVRQIAESALADWIARHDIS